jgi:hypothetical protein
MQKKLAKIKYFPNNFQILEAGDYVVCAISGKEISINDLNYWNVELQEPYYSYREAFKKESLLKKNKNFYFQRLCDHIHCSGLCSIMVSRILFKSSVIF